MGPYPLICYKLVGIEKLKLYVSVCEWPFRVEIILYVMVFWFVLIPVFLKAQITGLAKFLPVEDHDLSFLRLNVFDQN